jgi:hypothetical protein
MQLLCAAIRFVLAELNALCFALFPEALFDIYSVDTPSNTGEIFGILGAT